ncbi:Chloroplast protein FOR GROWTH AND FERTILITY 2 [Orobanche hederae]
MGTLMHSSSIPCKHNPISRFIPRLARPDSHRKPAPPSTTSFSLLPRLVLRRFNSSACGMNDFSLFSAKDCRPKESSSLAVESGNESNPKPHFRNRVAQIFSQQQKFAKYWKAFEEVKDKGVLYSSLYASELSRVTAINAGPTILLSTIFLSFLYPAIVPPAFASLGSAAKAGAPTLVRNELLTSAWTGFFAGCLHTLSGPDHLAALAPLSIGRTRMESAAVGALWGCGHDAGQLLFGLMFLLLKDRLHIEIIRTWGTRVVGFTLLVIGAMGIKEASEVPAPCVALGENGECDDVSDHENVTGPSVGKKKKKIGLATFGTGIIHGLQPDALMIILPALALPSRLAGAAFLVMFLVGTVIAMGSYTVFIGSCSQALKERVPRITEKLTWASSLIAIVLGLALLVSQYFGFSLY